MRTATAVAAIALAGAAVLLSGDGCPTCRGSKQVKCYQFGGTKGAQGACPACAGAKGSPCETCNATGLRPCDNCLRTGRIRAFRCRYCGGRGSLPCSMCDRGQIKCALCGGDGIVPVPCDICAGAGKLSCPECAVATEACAACKGSSREPCPQCQGKGGTAAACSECGGKKKKPCEGCKAYGAICCVQCQGLGAKTVQGLPPSPEILQGQPCKACNGRGGVPCGACRGRGGTPCAPCAGKGVATVPCPRCEGHKTIPCRRCVRGRVFRGESSEAGIRCVVFDCSVFQPELAKELRDVLGVGDFAVWRVVLDARETRTRFTLGGEKGWELALVVGSGEEAPMADACRGRSPDELKALEGWLKSRGDAPEALKRPFGLPGGDVRTCLALTPAGTQDDAVLFRLRSPGNELGQPVDLSRDEAGWKEWLKERILSAPE